MQKKSMFPISLDIHSIQLVFHAISFYIKSNNDKPLILKISVTIVSKNTIPR